MLNSIAGQRELFSTQSEPFVEDNFRDISGLRYFRGFLTRVEQQDLLNCVDGMTWLGDLKRRVQHYGYKYDYKARRVDESMRIGAIPQFLNGVGERLVEQRIFDKLPDQVIVNEYQPGQGIAAHIDCVPCFQDTIVTISLGSVYEMEFANEMFDERKTVDLELGSILVLQGDARHVWKHGIRPRKKDGTRPRRRRVSLTFRRVILSGD